MSKATASYGVRECSECAATYAARSSTSKTCSPECSKARKKAWTAADYRDNRVRHLARSAQWQAENREKARDRSRRYEASHREKRNARPRDAAKRAAQWQSWYAHNREAVIANAAERSRANPDARREAQSRRRARAVGTERYRVSVRDLDHARARARGLCEYCQSHVGEHWDHRVPLARGGAHAVGNLTLACAACNQQKHTKTVMEWRVWRIRTGFTNPNRSGAVMATSRNRT